MVAEAAAQGLARVVELVGVVARSAGIAQVVGGLQGRVDEGTGAGKVKQGFPGEAAEDAGEDVVLVAQLIQRTFDVLAEGAVALVGLGVFGDDPLEVLDEDDNPQADAVSDFAF